MAGGIYKVVLVEDSPDDVDLFQLALRRTGLSRSFDIIQCFPTGEAAINYFAHSESLQPGTRPEIAIIDLNLPVRDGFEVLAALPRNPCRPVTAVFSTSDTPEERERAASLGADLFLAKTYDSPDIERFLRSLADLADQRRATGT